MDVTRADGPRPHDLLQLSPTCAILRERPDGVPDWVTRSLAFAPWVVVRNSSAPPGRIPVGVRGTTRSERWATTVTPAEIITIRSPEDLVVEDVQRRARDVAAVRALGALKAGLDGVAWGPTGSVGFSLAAGRSVVGETSDLDVLVRCPIRPAPATLERIARIFAEQEARVDCLVDTPAGLAHHDEIRRGGATLVRTPMGIRLCDDPWAVTDP